MKIRKAQYNDIDCMMLLFKQAQKYFKVNNIDQWQNNYPNPDVLKKDIDSQQSYVLEDDNILGTMYFADVIDHNYDVIDGQWLNQGHYAVIHRIVVNESYKGHGLAKILLDYAITQCKEKGINSIRIDTHNDNTSMQSFLKKNGFVYCGKISLEDGSPRIGFELIIP